MNESAAHTGKEEPPDSILRYPMYWLMALGFSYLASITMLALGQDWVERSMPGFWKAISGPGIYQGSLTITAASSVRQPPYIVEIEARTKPFWSWSAPAYLWYDRAQLTWVARTSGKTEIDLRNGKILQPEGQDLLLSVETLGELVGGEIVTPEGRDRMQVLLECLEDAHDRLMPIALNQKFYGERSGLAFETTHVTTGSGLPVPVGALMAFWMGIILILTQVPGPWREMRRD